MRLFLGCQRSVVRISFCLVSFRICGSRFQWRAVVFVPSAVPLTICPRLASELTVGAFCLELLVPGLHVMAGAFLLDLLEQSVGEQVGEEEGR